MKRTIIALAVGAFIANPVGAVLPIPGAIGAPRDARYCGEPERDKHGVIKRSDTQRNRFIAVWPMPVEGGPWYVDHVIPLEAGGCDLPFNMQWLPAKLKTCAGYCKDRFERTIYHTPDVQP